MIDKRKVPKHEDMTGKKCNRWTIVKAVPKNHEKYHKHALYFCRCDCGTESIVAAVHIRSGRSKSCGCIRLEAISKRPFESIYHRLCSHNVGVPINLSYEEFLEFTKVKNCHYCDSDLDWNNVVKIRSSYRVDRKNNDLGYSKENCVACCGDCNRTKGDRFTYEEFMLLAPALRQIVKGRQQTKETI